MPIKKEKRDIPKMPKEKAEKTQAFKLGKGKHKDNNIFEIDVNIKTGNGWVFVHDNKTAFVVTEVQNQLETIHEIEEFNTEKECLDEIDRLGLIYKEQAHG